MPRKDNLGEIQLDFAWHQDLPWTSAMLSCCPGISQCQQNC